MATRMLLTAVLIAAAPAARAAAPVKVTSVEEKGGKLFIHATAKPEFTVFKLSGPPRVVIDLNEGDVSGAVQSGESAGHHSIHRAGIAGWSAAQFDERGVRVGRIVVALEGDQKYDVAVEGSDLVLSVGEDKPQAPEADPDLVLSREDVQEVKNPAHRLGRISVGEIDGTARVFVKADGEIGKLGILELKNPARLALDLHGVRGRFAKAPGVLLVKGVRVGKTEDGARVVIDGAGATMPKYLISRVTDGLEVVVGERAPLVEQKRSPAANPAAEAPTGSQVVAELADSKITVNVQSVKAGTIKIGVRNLGTMEHSFVVLKTDLPQDKLPVDGASAKAKEDGKVGEIPSIPAGKSASVTVELTPGKYVFICNIAGHYQLGMHTGFTVDAP